MIDSRARGSGIGEPQPMADVPRNVKQQLQEVQPDSPPPPPHAGFMQKFRLYETRSV